MNKIEAKFPRKNFDWGETLHEYLQGETTTDFTDEKTIFDQPERDYIESIILVLSDENGWEYDDADWASDKDFVKDCEVVIIMKDDFYFVDMEKMHPQSFDVMKSEYKSFLKESKEEPFDHFGYLADLAYDERDIENFY